MTTTECLGFTLERRDAGLLVAAVAGAVFASYISFIDPSNFTLSESIFVLAIITLEMIVIRSLV